MSSSRKWKFRVRHILEAIATAQHYIDGLSLETFGGDSKTVDAVLTNSSSSEKRLRSFLPTCRSAIRGVPWGKLKGLRNVIVHQYDRVDVRLVWNAVRLDLPPLVAPLQRLLDEEPEE